MNSIYCCSNNMGGIYLPLGIKEGRTINQSIIIRPTSIWEEGWEVGTFCRPLY
jgi:hypothetical protein